MQIDILGQNTHNVGKKVSIDPILCLYISKTHYNRTDVVLKIRKLFGEFYGCSSKYINISSKMEKNPCG